MQFWKIKDIFEAACTECGKPIEFFKDDPQARCPGCGLLVKNPRIDLGCAKWCKFADKCLEGQIPVGVDTEEVGLQGDGDILRNKFIGEMKSYFGADRKRIDHALAVLGYAEQIQEIEGGDPFVVRTAAILHDIGIPLAEEKYKSSAGNLQEIEGPPVAREILLKYNIPADIIERICSIIANHHSAKDIDTVEFRIVWDADWLVNIPDEYGELSVEKIRGIIEKVFKTQTGKDIAFNLYT